MAILKPNAAPIAVEPGIVTLYWRSPPLLIAVGLSGIVGLFVSAAAVLEVFPVDSTAIVVAITAACFAPMALVVGFEFIVHRSRAAVLESRSPGAVSWAGTPAESLSAIFREINEGASFALPLKVIVLLEADELSLWQMRRGWLTQCLRVERASVAGVRKARVTAIEGDEDHLFIAVTGDPPVELEIQPTIPGSVNRRLLTFDSTESARVLTRKWLSGR